MEVAVENSLDDRAFHERDHGGAYDVLGVDTSVLHSGHVIKVEAVNPLHHERPAGHERGVRTGCDISILPEVMKHAGDVEHVRCLHPEVEFLHDCFGKDLDERRWVGERSNGDAADQKGGQPGHDLEVFTDEA